MSSTKKLRPKNVAKREGVMNDDVRLLQFSPISFLIFFLFGLPMLGYLAMRYYGRDPYGDFAALLLLLGIIGLIGGITVNYSFNSEKSFQFQNFYLKDVDRILYFILFIVVLFGSLAFIWAFLGTTLRYALSSTELYFYYIGAAIMEEIFFRYFLCGTSKTYLNDLRKKNQNNLPETGENLLLGLLSATIFMVAHWEVYGKSMIGMLAVFFGGIMFTLFYLYTKDISITIIAHIWVNIIAVNNLLIATGGA